MRMQPSGGTTRQETLNYGYATGKSPLKREDAERCTIPVGTGYQDKDLVLQVILGIPFRHVV